MLVATVIAQTTNIKKRSVREAILKFCSEQKLSNLLKLLDNEKEEHIFN